MDAVGPAEIEPFVSSIREFQVENVGNKMWLDNHEKLLKLNQQAVIEASSHREEVVKELLVVNDKLAVLVHEAYCIVVWKTKVLKKLLESSEISATFFIYTILYHELIAISLLETVLYHESSCECLGDTVIDLIDYCVFSITQLIALCHSGYHQKVLDPKQELKPSEELENQRNEITFNLGMKAITILSYLSDKIGSLSVSAARRLTQTHDVPCLLSELLSLRPWMRRIKSFEKFIDGKWVAVEGTTEF